MKMSERGQKSDEGRVTGQRFKSGMSCSINSHAFTMLVDFHVAGKCFLLPVTKY
jgi:hypothetical protein